MRKLFAFGCALALLVFGAAAVRANLYGFVDTNGRVYVSTVKVDDRYQLFKRTPAQPASVAKREIELPAIREGQRKRYTKIIKRVAKKYRVEEALLHAVISAESGYNPNAVSPRGATGLMQLMPDVAEQYGVSDAHDPSQNVSAGARHLRSLMREFDNDLQLVLAAYNAGPTTVKRYGRAIPPYPETRNYVPRVLGYYKRYQAEI